MPFRDEIRAADAALVGSIAEGDEGALREVIERHGPVAFGVAWRVLRVAALAEEVAQDTFLALWMHPERFDPSRGNLRTLLVRIARNKAIDKVRQVAARREAGALHEEQDFVDDDSRAAYDEIIDRDQLKGALSKLSDLQREALVLVYFKGLSLRELAEELGIPEGTAKSRVRDGLIKLRHFRRGISE